MVAQLVAELTKACSAHRLERYRPAGGSDLDMLTNYVWNMDLAVALAPSLNAAEIALRNTIYFTFEAFFRNPLWFYEPELLQPNQLATFASAYRAVSERKKGAVTPGLLVAELSFGFWTALLSVKYNRIWTDSKYAPFHAAFPHARRVPLDRVGKRFNDIRALRNRVAHHEPILFDRDLIAEHGAIHEAIDWINPTLGSLIRVDDAFPRVANGRAAVEQRIERRFAHP